MKSLDPYIKSKLAKHMQTHIEKANPTMSIQVTRAKMAVMDSTYWRVETIRTKTGLGDLSIVPRRMRPYGRPDRLYNIYVDNGEVKVATREYPSYTEQKWFDEFSLGNGNAVAIAIDANWEVYRMKWQPVTDEFPYLFWVDNSNKLWVQYWDDTNTKRELATNVNKVKALRGWKNVNILENDQGIVVAYIKNNGKVYYRNYCIQSDGITVWENEREVTEFTGTAININLFITNDYRMGLVIENSQGKIYWLITKRNWAGMAIRPEHITVAPSVELEFIKIEYPQIEIKEYITVSPSVELGFGAINNKILELENLPDNEDDWGWIIHCHTREDMVNLSLANITVTDVLTNSPIGIASINVIDSRTFTLYASDAVENGFNNVLGDINVKISGVFNPAGTVIANVDRNFTPINLVPMALPIPEVDEIWNE